MAKYNKIFLGKCLHNKGIKGVMQVFVSSGYLSPTTLLLFKNNFEEQEIKE